MGAAGHIGGLGAGVQQLTKAGAHVPHAGTSSAVEVQPFAAQLRETLAAASEPVVGDSAKVAVAPTEKTNVTQNGAGLGTAKPVAGSGTTKGEAAKVGAGKNEIAKTGVAEGEVAKGEVTKSEAGTSVAAKKVPEAGSGQSKVSGSAPGSEGVAQVRLVGRPCLCRRLNRRPELRCRLYRSCRLSRLAWLQRLL